MENTEAESVEDMVEARSNANGKESVMPSIGATR
jgi:hypothetical protein